MGWFYFRVSGAVEFANPPLNMANKKNILLTKPTKIQVISISTTQVEKRISSIQNKALFLTSCSVVGDAWAIPRQVIQKNDIFHPPSQILMKFDRVTELLFLIAKTNFLF